MQPTYDELRNALLRALRSHPARELRPKEAYELVAEDLNVSARIRAELHSDGRNLFENRLQWARQALVNDGLLDGSIHGLWRLPTSSKIPPAAEISTEIARPGTPVHDRNPPTELDLSILVDAGWDAPMYFRFGRSVALEAAVINRGHLNVLVDSWRSACGVYLLLPNAPGLEPMYVGRATTGHLSRLRAHHSKPPMDWQRALLVAGTNVHPFNSAEASWLEGELVSVLASRSLGGLANANSPRDRTLSRREVAALKRLVDPILQIASLLGVRLEGAPTDAALDVRPPNLDAEPHRPDTAGSASTDGEPRRIADRPARRRALNVSDLISAGLLRPGDRLSGRRNGVVTAAVVTRSGQLRLADGTEGSPSKTAGIACGHSENGWNFWRLGPDGRGESLSELRDKV